MSRNRYSVNVTCDTDVLVSDIFEKLDYEDIRAHIDVDEFLDDLDESILIKNLEKWGYEVKKL